MPKVFLEGLKVGFMFQIIIGPICFYLFKISITNGFITGIIGALGCILADLIFIILAIFGIEKVLSKFPQFKQISAFIGMLILCLYGIYIIIQTIFSYHNPENIINQQSYSKVFIYTLMLTLSNPITILYWSGSFSIIALKCHDKAKLFMLGFGAFITTPIFLFFWISFSSYFGRFLSFETIRILHFLIGFILIFYGIRIYNTNRKIMVQC